MAEAKFAALPCSQANGEEMWTFDVDAINPPHNATCNRVFDFLYIGGYLAAENLDWLQNMRVTCVINVRKETITNTIDTVEYVNIAVNDEEYEPIHWYFDETIEKIEAHRKADGRVLVNCEMGISRSATICMMYMIRCQNRSLRDAYYQLKKLRPCIRPNIYFWRPMINYEKTWRPGKASVAMLSTTWAKAIPDVYLL